MIIADVRSLFTALLLLITTAAYADYKIDLFPFGRIERNESENIFAVSIVRSGDLSLPGSATVRWTAFGEARSYNLFFRSQQANRAAYIWIDDRRYAPNGWQGRLDLFVDGKYIEGRDIIIIDDDTNPRITLSDAAVTEGGDATFTISIDPVSVYDTNMQIRTANGTASEADYTTFDKLVTIPPKTGHQTITIPTKQDGVSESDETFTVRIDTLYGPTDATFAKREASCVILDDERPFERITGPDRADAGQIVQPRYTIQINPSATGGTINLKSSPPGLLSVPATLNLPAFANSVSFTASIQGIGDAVITAELPATHNGTILSKSVNVSASSELYVNPKSVVVEQGDFKPVVIGVYPYAGNTPVKLHVANRMIAEVEESIVEEAGLASEVWVWGITPGKTEIVISLPPGNGGGTFTIPVEVYSNKRRRSAR